MNRRLDVRCGAILLQKSKIETTLKISRKLIFRLLCCCLAIQRRYEEAFEMLMGPVEIQYLKNAVRVIGICHLGDQAKSL